MEDKNKMVELENEKLKEVDGGLNVGNFDKCHYDPSRWAETWYFTGGKGECGTCLYNPHRGWLNSMCDYPNEHQDK